MAESEFNAKWWQAQNTDPLYLQQVADVFGQVPGNEAAFKNPALRAITQQGQIGNDPSGFIARLNEAFKSRNMTSPFSSTELADSATAAQRLNEGEVSESGQIQRRLSDRTRTETNDLAARGILQSGENAYRAGERNLLGNQLNYASFQGLLDRIEGLNAGKLAAEQAHKQNLWKYLESATTRMSAAEAARRAKDSAAAAAAATANVPSTKYGPPTQSGGGGVPIGNWVPPVGSPIPGGINTGVTPPGGLLPGSGVPSGTWTDDIPPNTINNTLTGIDKEKADAAAAAAAAALAETRKREYALLPTIPSSRGAASGSLGVPIVPKPKPLPKVSGAYTSSVYRSLAGKL